MSQQRKLSRHNSKQSSIGETASVGSTKSVKSNGSSEYSSSLSNGHNHQMNGNGKKTNGLSKHGSQESTGGSSIGSQTITTTTTTTQNILNVAEMLLHGVADNEIIDIWLRSIQCEEFVAKFINSGYDVPTLSRVTPQDLTAIGVTDPTKRLKILAEIKKLNLQDGIPNFVPASLSHWLSLIRLDSYYYKSLCDQNVDTIDKLCQLTWEDFEELGITKLGHQKRFQLAIERVKELKQNSKNGTGSKPISEPIYDSNPSQILLVASAENHSVNGPIINKQSSTSELSSIDSGSMHSVYSAASTHYQPNYAPSSDNQSNHTLPNMMVAAPNQSQQLQQQAIYSQLPNRISQQQHYPVQVSPGTQAQPPPQQQSHYQAFQNQHTIYQQQQQQQQKHNGNNQYMTTISNPALNQSNRQSLGQLPFSSLAKLTKYQQQMLQQSSIYATLSRQPSRAKQPPPPVPIRTNSLKSESLIDDTNIQQQQQQYGPDCYNQFNDFRMGGRMLNNRNQFNSHTMLTKNKSFSGSAHMDASRARFLNRNSQQIQQQQQPLQPHHFQPAPQQQISLPQQAQQQQCNATTGKDDEFPPPPSPLAQTDFDEQPIQQHQHQHQQQHQQQLDLVSINSDCNFTDVNHGLMTFRVET